MGWPIEDPGSLQASAAIRRDPFGTRYLTLTADLALRCTLLAELDVDG